MYPRYVSYVVRYMHCYIGVLCTAICVYACISDAAVGVLIGDARAMRMLPELMHAIAMARTETKTQ